jgi:hypothetical protein
MKIASLTDALFIDFDLERGWRFALTLLCDLFGELFIGRRMPSAAKHFRLAPGIAPP